MAETDDDAARAHRRAWDAIPWVVAGSAPADDAAFVRAHLPHCEACRDELAFHERLHRGLNAGAAPRTDTEAGLQRVLARIDAAGAERAAPRPRGMAPVRWLAAAVIVQAVALGAIGLSRLNAPAPEAEFRTLSSPLPARAATLRVAPAPGLDFGTLAALLAELKLELVEIAPDGTSLGLAPADGRAGTQQAALARLRATPGIRMAEPTGHALR